MGRGLLLAARPARNLQRRPLHPIYSFLVTTPPACSPLKPSRARSPGSF